MKLTASKRMDRLEVKSAHSIEALAEDQRNKKAAALEEWRQQNCTRIAWDLFALIEGPKLEHPDNYVKEEGEEEDVFVDSYLAYFAMIDRVLKFGLDEEGFLKRSKMSTEERAFAVCFDHLFNRTDTDDGWLLNKGIFDQNIALGNGLALHNGEITVAEAVQCIDEHRGGPEWRQICDSNEAQEALDAKFGIPSITEIPPKGREWVDPGGRP